MESEGPHARDSVIAHRARCQALLKVVSAALGGGELSLTQLGRRLQGSAHEKHQIKAVDRLLGNRHLHRERDRMYARSRSRCSASSLVR
jgi:hypothetical protein